MEYREKYPESSYLELAEIITLETGYKIGKSGVNHHFIKMKKLMESHMSKKILWYYSAKIYLYIYWKYKVFNFKNIGVLRFRFLNGIFFGFFKVKVYDSYDWFK